MNAWGRTILFITVGSALLVIGGRGNATQAVWPLCPAPSSQWSTGKLGSPMQKAASRAINHAVRDLEAAALQLDFSSNDRELSLLYSAHDRLATAIDKLCCMQRERAAILEADIDHVILRDSALFGPDASPAGDRFGPPAPTRAQLVRLVREGQNLARNAPFAYRLRSWDTLDSTGQAGSAAGDTLHKYALDGPGKSSAMRLSDPIASQSLPGPRS